MEILLVTHKCWPNIGGIQIATCQLAKHLVSAGHSVTVVSSALRADGTNDGDEMRGVRVIRVPAISPFERLGVPYPLFHPRLYSTIRHEIQRTDVVHVHGMLFMSSVLASRLARGLNKPLVVTEHAGSCQYPSRIIRAAQTLAIDWLGKRTLRSAHKVTCVGHGINDWLLQLGLPSHNVTLIPNGVDTNRFHPVSVEEKHLARNRLGLPTNGQLVLFVGRLRRKKGLDLVVGARSDRYTLVVAGSGEPDIELPADDRLVALRDVPYNRMHDVYNAADLFILPSYGEGLGLTVLEAMAAGLPIIVSKDPHDGTDLVGAAHGLSQRYVLRVVPNALEIRREVESLLSTPEHMKEMACYSRECAERVFSWKECACAYLEVYAAAVDALRCEQR